MERIGEFEKFCLAYKAASSLDYIWTSYLKLVCSVQVTVWVSGFLSLCGDGADCSFSYDSSLTPSISGVTDALVDGSVELTIAGTGFTTDPADFSISVGGRNCEATAATATSVTCTLENGPAGDFDINLWVKSRGQVGKITKIYKSYTANFF